MTALMLRCRFLKGTKPICKACALHQNCHTTQKSTIQAEWMVGSGNVLGSRYWLKLAESAAFRKGIGTYCGYKNPVEAGMWAGGIVGVILIFGLKIVPKPAENNVEAFRTV